MVRIVVVVAIIAGMAFTPMGGAFAAGQRIHGDYALTGEMACLGAVNGFNANFIPLSGPTWVDSYTNRGAMTFRRDGTGAASIRSIILRHSPSLSAYSNDVAWDLTYTIDSDRAITVNGVPGSFTGSFLTGPLEGMTFTQTAVTLSGTVSKDGNTITLAGLGDPEIKTTTRSDGSVSYSICHRSYILLKLEEGHHHGHHR